MALARTLKNSLKHASSNLFREGRAPVPSHFCPLPINGLLLDLGAGLQTLQETRSEAESFSHNDLWILRLRQNGVGLGAGNAASRRL